MANTYTQIYLHIVFAVRGRDDMIKPEYKEEIHKYITGNVKNGDPRMALADLVRDIKRNSSNFINEKKWLKAKFYWQEGYGAFSYSRSQLDSVIKYIMAQEEHHKTKDFTAEYLEMLEKFQVDYDLKYLFD